MLVRIYGWGAVGTFVATTSLVSWGFGIGHPKAVLGVATGVSLAWPIAPFLVLWSMGKEMTPVESVLIAERDC